jgi:hypothetical protein
MASQLATVLLWEDAVEEFKNYVLPTVKAMLEQDGEPDYVGRSTAWNDWTDSLCKDGRISDWQYANWSHPPCCG